MRTNLKVRHHVNREGKTQTPFGDQRLLVAGSSEILPAIYITCLAYMGNGIFKIRPCDIDRVNT